MKNRPGWITFIAYSLFLGAIISLSYKQSFFDLMNTDRGIAYFLLASNLLGFYTGFGLLKLRNWARIATIGVLLVYFAQVILIQKQALVIFYFLFFILVLNYLLNEDISDLFKRSSVKKTRRKKGRPSLSYIEKKKILKNTYLGLARVFAAKGEKSPAFDYYKKAIQNGAFLKDDDVLFVSECFAEKGTADKSAVNFYLRYIKLVPVEKAAEDRVYRLLERISAVDETTMTAERKSRLVLNKQIVQANPKIEWAQFYLGLGHALNQDHVNASIYLQKALNLNPERRLTYYWLGINLIQAAKINKQPIPVDRVKTLFIKFLSFQPEDKKESQKQGHAAFELGGLLIGELGGFDVVPDPKSEEIQSKLIEAIGYLQRAVDENRKNDAYLFRLGRAHSLSQSHDKAAALFEEAIKLEPKKKEYHYQLAHEYWKLDQKAKAKKNLISAVALDKAYVDAYRLLSKICYANKEYAELQVYCVILRGLNVPDPENTLFLVISLYHQGKHSDVIGEIEKLPDFPLETDVSQEAGFCTARSHALLGAIDKSIEWYRKLPESARNNYYLGCALRMKGADQKAAALFSLVIDQGEEFLSEALLQRGHLYFKQGDLERAGNDYEKALEINPGRSEITSSLGMVYFNRGDVKKAGVFFKKTLDMETKHTLAHFGMGLISERGGDIKTAQKEYQIAAHQENAPRHYVARLGIACAKLGEHEKAVPLLEQVKEAGCGDASLLFYLGLSYLSTQQHRKGLDVWKNLLEHNPDDERLSVNIARGFYLLGAKHMVEEDIESAILSWSEYLEQYAADDKTRHDIGQLYFRMGLKEFKKAEVDNARAAEILSKALEFDGENDLYRFYLALARMESGEHSDASAELRKLIDVDTGNKRYRYHFALNLYKGGKKAEALKLFEKMMGDGRKDTYGDHAAGVLANEHIKNNDLGKAVSLLEKAV